MLQKERRNQILALLRKQSMVKIPELAKAFGVSVITIRRDLDELVRTGQVQKVYGGAILAQQADPEPEAQRLFHARLAHNHREKMMIGMAAAKLVKDSETIILNIGTTALEVAKHLDDHENLTVLTNSIPILNQLANTRLNVYSLGG